MITRRTLLGAAAGAGIFAVLPTSPAFATSEETQGWTDDVSANGWPIDQTAIVSHQIEGSEATVNLRPGHPAAVLLHVARRWHYEIAPLDTGEGGGVAAYEPLRLPRASFESNYLSGTAIALHPAAYPVGGSEPLWPHHEKIVRDILADCRRVVRWGGDLTPHAYSHFEIAVPPHDQRLARVAGQLDSRTQTGSTIPAPGAVEDPASPALRDHEAETNRPN